MGPRQRSPAAAFCTGAFMQGSMLRPRVRHLYICDFHKNFIQSVRNKRKRKTSDDGGDSPEHDADVPETVSRHFRNIPVNEKETLACFVYTVKSSRGRLDPKPEGGKQLE
ncbi:PREDICTED: histone deacetylase complex subunit SAP30L [Condylura cristata]|uniref:histone deacetylase complex subunit SAP30L n=1 Tax=Condylura cristata TaxID=143302 RepID=UPI0006430F0C|nr:PREDICTED: histone deacetylase complex subunit SAP30L [Condylura cristata]